MQINNVASQLTGLANSNTPAAPSLLAALGKSSANAASNSQSTTTSTAQARAILSNYDVHNITPQQLTTMVQQLSDAGVLTPQDANDLNQLRSQLDAQGIGANEPVDLISKANDLLSQQQQSLQKASQVGGNASQQQLGQTQVAQTTRQISWLEKFATIHADASSGVSVVA